MQFKPIHYFLKEKNFILLVTEEIKTCTDVYHKPVFKTKYSLKSTYKRFTFIIIIIIIIIIISWMNAE